MPSFRAATDFPCQPSTLFEFLIQPANILRITPPDLNSRLMAAPERLALGDQLRLEMRPLGMKQSLVLQIVAFEIDTLLTDEQLEGPFRRFRHERRLQAIESGVQLIETIDYEPPSGMLGLLLTPARIERNIAEMYSYRIETMRGLLIPAGEFRP